MFRLFAVVALVLCGVTAKSAQACTPAKPSARVRVSFLADSDLASLANAEVRAPYAGVLTNLDLKVGEFASAGEPVVTIADTSQWVVKTTDLTEIDVVSLKEGEQVTVTFDALADQEFKGNVLTIAQNYSENQGDVVYEATILLTEASPEMRWGMTAEVKFEK